MGYEINVALNGKHLFATHERSLRNLLEIDALEVFHLVAEKFPKSEGYEVTMTEWKTTARQIQPE